MRVKIDIDMGAVMGHVEQLRRAAVWGASEQALTDCNLYVPLDQGTLRASSLTHSNTENGHLEWATPYAHYQFEGRVYGPNIPIFDGGVGPVGFFSPPVKHPTGRRLRYKRGKNPNASAKWTEKATELHADDWRRAAEAAMKGKSK